MIFFDNLGTSDPYCVLSQGAVSIKTKVIQKNINPVWDERLEMGIYEKDVMAGELVIKVFDKDMLADDSIGSTRLPLSSIPHNQPREFVLNVSQLILNALFFSFYLFFFSLQVVNLKQITEQLKCIFILLMVCLFILFLSLI